MTDKNAIELFDKLAQSLGYASFAIYNIVGNAFCVAFQLDIMRYDSLCDSNGKELELTGSYADSARQLYKMFSDGHDLYIGGLCVNSDDGRIMQFMLEYELLAAM